MGFSPFAIWQYLPGFDRVQRTVELLTDTEFRAAMVFRPEGMLRWLTRIRPHAAPKPTLASLVSAERFAAECDKAFRKRVQWWGG